MHAKVWDLENLVRIEDGFGNFVCMKWIEYECLYTRGSGRRAKSLYSTCSSVSPHIYESNRGVPRKAKLAQTSWYLRREMVLAEDCGAIE